MSEAFEKWHEGLAAGGRDFPTIEGAWNAALAHDREPMACGHPAGCLTELDGMEASSIRCLVCEATESLRAERDQTLAKCAEGLLVANYVIEHNDILCNSPGYFSKLTTLAREARLDNPGQGPLNQLAKQQARIEVLERDRDMFWPPHDEIEEHLYEIRNGKTPAYVREHATALGEALAAVDAKEEK